MTAQQLSDGQDENASDSGESHYKNHPVTRSILNLVQNTRDCEQAHNTFFTEAIDQHNAQADYINAEIDAGFEDSESPNGPAKSVAWKRISQAIRQSERLSRSDIPKTLSHSLFLYLFSAFDRFLGELLLELYSRKPELTHASEKTLTLSELSRFSSIDEARDHLVQNEIEDLRRKSYVEQFRTLEQRFGITLRKFDGWPKFVERSQRRNLLTHCGGYVTRQYLQVCQSEGVRFHEAPSVGQHLDITRSYFSESCSLLSEVAVKLAQVLWRKTLPEETRNADSALLEVIFDYLHEEDWKKAEILGRFAVDLNNIGDDLHDRINIINYAIALKAQDRPSECIDALDRIDWSAAILDFRLAEAVLRDDYDRAADLMRRIGTKGELVHELSYHEWPLFRWFRETDQFVSAYADVFGYPFTVELRQAAQRARTEHQPTETDVPEQ